MGATATPLYEEASERVGKQGVAMAQDDAIVAPCEKSLVAFPMVGERCGLSLQQIECV